MVKYDAGLILNHMRGTPETWAKLGPMKDVMGIAARGVGGGGPPRDAWQVWTAIVL